MERWTAKDPRTFHFLSHELVDLNKPRVIELLRDRFQRPRGLCACVECLADIAAMTLSGLVSDYRWSTSDWPPKVSDAELSAALDDAIRAVGNRPRHDAEGTGR